MRQREVVDTETGEITLEELAFNRAPRTHQVYLDENGAEIPDQRPVALPLGFKHPEDLAETIKRMVRLEISDAAQAGGEESFEEADDFDVGDDYDPTSPYEQHFDQDENLRADEVALRKAHEQRNARFRREQFIEEEPAEEPVPPPEPRQGSKRPRSTKGRAASPPRAQQAPEGDADRRVRRDYDTED